MLTIFSTAKPFKGHTGIIQRNAIHSWILLNPKCEIILFGDDEGTAEIAAKLDIRHIPDVEHNNYGTPLLSSMFDIAQDVASYKLMCYINADIILTSDFLPAVQRVCKQKQKFLVVGQRWDYDLDKLVDFNRADWEKELRAKVIEHGKVHPKCGIDYFVFPRGLYDSIPPFAIGRSGWDNWMIYQARFLKIPVIDATKAITAIHQNHDYSHTPGGLNGIINGPEKKQNIVFMGGVEHAFSLDNATLILTPQGLKPALTMRYLYFRLYAITVLFPYLHFLRKPIVAIPNLLRLIRLMRA